LAQERESESISKRERAREGESGLGVMNVDVNTIRRMT
jgi:hypothetical protein